MRTVLNEYAKMRHRAVGLICAIMMLASVLLALFAVVSADVDPDGTGAWYALLAGLSMGIPLLSPLLLAVLASRQTDIEHRGNGWLWQATSGATPGGVCRAKLVALGSVVAVATLGTGLVVLVLGRLLVGIRTPVPLWHWVGFTTCMLVINLVVLALHILISAKLENQLVGLGVGVLGSILAVFSQGLPSLAAHATPWGYYSLARAAGYQGDVLRRLPIAYPSVAVLAVLAGVLFVVVTHRFDEQEA
ncbi:ABC transporter permease [Enemella sp. A6]|uniref:ABC transporter permease n=1 Tax=Enemella sp. A6 TaxID=3440152 RepID=UPI003EBC578B